MKKKVWVYNNYSQDVIGILEQDGNMIRLPNSVSVRFDDEEFKILSLKQVWCCSECGSTDVESKVWQNMNTGEFAGGDVDEYWCNGCEKHLGVITLEEYLKRENE